MRAPRELCIHCADVRDCPDCLPGGSTVDQFIDAHPSGATFAEVAEAMRCSKQAIEQAEARILRKLREAAGESTDQAARDERQREHCRASYARKKATR